MKKNKYIFLFTLILVVVIGGSYYLFTVATIAGDKDFLKDEKKDYFQTQKNWFEKEKNKDILKINSFDNLALKGYYFPAEKKTDKVAIVVHGYMSKADNMAQYASFFHKQGYNVLAPDLRASGKSAGKYIGYGYLESQDLTKWIDKVLEKNGTNSQIILDGVSMGASTVMQATNKHLPNNVKAIIEDCGYASAAEELEYELWEQYRLPVFPFIPVANLFNQLIAGYSYYNANVYSSLAHNKIPILFIHGTKDTFVPYNNLDKVYNADHGPKEKYIVKNAEHAKAYQTDPENYEKRIKKFLQKYNK